MKKSLLLFLISLFAVSLYATDAAMYQWKSHFAYGSVSQVVDAGNMIYGLAGGALFSIDKQTEEIQTYSKQNGLNGGDIACIGYDTQSGTLIISYTDGMIDFLKEGSFVAMMDLQQKSLSVSKQTNKIYIYNGIAYFCMPFGIIAVDVKNRLIKDTYYIGENGSDVNVLDVAFDTDSVFAISSSTFYSVARTANWMDYKNWNRVNEIAFDSLLMSVAVWNNQLFIVADSTLFLRKNNHWTTMFSDKVLGLCPSDGQLFLRTGKNEICYLSTDLSKSSIPSAYIPLDVAAQGSTYWLATSNNGIVRQTKSEMQSFAVNGPLVNIPYRMRFNGDKLIMVPGGYYVEQTYQPGCVMLYENDNWTGFTHEQLWMFANIGAVSNVCDAIIDPKDPTHFFAGSLGSGLFEFRDNQLYKWYHADNSFLDKIASRSELYTWVDGFAYDSKGNLWMINLANTRNIKVLQNDGQWIAIDHAAANTMQRARDLLIWNKNENIKIITCNHTEPGLLILDDKGTIANQSDDQCVMRTEFIDQDNNRVQMNDLYSIAQDKNGALWVGTDAGLVIIDDPSALLKSNACRKIKIPRNDGTGLADYLLETEQINAIAVDGANRKWIGTTTSGLYVVSEDGLETIHHFTIDNSPLINNAIVSLAIQPSTGRVFIGTGKGLMSYQNDAAPAVEEYNQVYVYPNPVRPDYEGVITIRGLMDETIVHITDNAGNLVCETRSNGGIAIWDGKTADGRRAASGVYNIFLNENSGNSHAVTKILLMH